MLCRGSNLKYGLRKISFLQYRDLKTATFLIDRKIWDLYNIGKNVELCNFFQGDDGMDRRMFRIFLCISLALICLTACGDDEPNDFSSSLEGQHTHQFGDWQAVFEASCTTDGQLVRRCVCGKVEYSTAPAFGHTPISDPYEAPSCTRSGLTEGSHCDICGAILLQQQQIAPTGHDEVIATPTKEATCTENGYTASTCCTTCNETLSSSTVILAKGHTPAILSPAKEPTCIQPGTSASSYCSICEEILSSPQFIPAKGHTPVLDTPEKAATCTETGLSAASHCDSCGNILSTAQIIPATGHTEVIDLPQAPTCTDNGATEGAHCSVCNEILRPQTILPKLGHDMAGDQCQRCHANANASAGLEFTLSSDASYYILTGYGSCTDTDLLLPSTYRGKPVTAVGSSAFSQCRSIHSIELSGSISVIESNAFYRCTGLTAITIPAQLTQIGNNAFSGCASLASITVHAENTVYHSTGNCLIETESKTLIVGCKTAGSPSTVL